MHLLAHRISRFALLLDASLILTLLAASQPGQAQSRSGLPGRSDVMICSVGSLDGCPPRVLYSAGIPQAATLESTRQEAAMARWQEAQERQCIRRHAAEEFDYQDERPPHATPDAADQSDLLKRSKDPDFILRNFKTMCVQTRDIEYFRAAEMKAALVRNPDFRKLNIRLVDDPRVADAVLVVSYTFAWDYPFELRHQNTTTVLLAGKGEGPFSPPLGAADVARQFVKLAKPWRTPNPEK
jgi:hypothetical protein